MKLNWTLLFVASLALPYQALAANAAYGTVSEIIIRSGDNGDTSLYFRLDVLQERSTFENCIVTESSLVWHLDLTSPVAEYQYNILERSYIQQLPVRVIGYDNVCANGQKYSDKVFELSPWSWANLLKNQLLK